MGASKRDRQRQNREAARAAMAKARRRAARRRQVVLLVILAAVVGGVAFVISRLSGDDTQTATTTNTSTTVPAASQSAVGKPCVPVADQLPAGAPVVPVKLGEPPTQLIKEDLKPGTGAEVAPGSRVTVNYIGVACSTGKIFDSSYSRNQPATFGLNEVIKGWTDGIPGMKVGGQRLLGIPAPQAYGAAGRPPNIGPDEPLWFVVEVLDAKAG